MSLQDGTFRKASLRFPSAEYQARVANYKPHLLLVTSSSEEKFVLIP